MLEKLGKRRYAIPLVAFLVALSVMSLVIYPMVTAEPKNLPLGVLSLDEEADSPQGTVHIGDDITREIIDIEYGEGETSTILWTEYASQAELDAAFANQAIYAAIVIPQDLSSSLVEAQTDATEKRVQILAEQLLPALANPQTPAASREAALAQTIGELSEIEAGESKALKLIINEGKNPMVAATVEMNIKGMLHEKGAHFEVERLNEVSMGGGSLNVVQAFTVIPTFIISLICSVVLFVMTRLAPTATWEERLRTICLRCTYALCLSSLIGFSLAGFLVLLGLEISVIPLALFLWLASFALMLLFVGCLSIAPPLGIAVALVCFGCGLACGNLPYELLPELYQDWFYPWVPQRFMGEGVRQILYQGAGIFNSATGGLIGTAAVGLAAYALSLFIPRKKRGSESGETAV